MVRYNSNSPWFTTNIVNKTYLNFLNIRPVPATNDDVVYTIDSAYHQRPDLLAFDIYGSKDLWWVFAQRNMNVLKDPIYDFTSGTEIYLPQKSLVLRELS